MRRRTKNIQLIALGTVVLTGCDPDLPDSRYIYENHDECIQDWGEKNCEHGPESHFFWSGGGYCYGPYYNTQVNLPSGERVWSGRPGILTKHPYSNRLLGATSVNVQRGGFGSSSRRFFSLGS